VAVEIVGEFESTAKVDIANINKSFASWFTVGYVAVIDDIYYIHDGDSFVGVAEFFRNYTIDDVNREYRDRLYNRIAMWI